MNYFILYDGMFCLFSCCSDVEIKKTFFSSFRLLALDEPPCLIENGVMGTWISLWSQWVLFPLRLPVHCNKVQKCINWNWNTAGSQVDGCNIQMKLFFLSEIFLCVQWIFLCLLVCFLGFCSDQLLIIRELNMCWWCGLVENILGLCFI